MQNRPNVANVGCTVAVFFVTRLTWGDLRSELYARKVSEKRSRKSAEKNQGDLRIPPVKSPIVGNRKAIVEASPLLK